jgi:hypothetical protein
MEKQENFPRKKSLPPRWGKVRTEVIVAGGMLAAFLAIFVSQAFAAGISVSSATIYDGNNVVYPTVYEANWVTKANKTWTFTPDVTSGTVTTVSLTATVVKNTAIRVQLLDAAATIISTGCVVTGGTTGGPFSYTVDVTDVAFSSVKTVKAVGGTLSCP